MSDELLTIEDVARQLKVTLRFARWLMSTGQLQSSRLGKRNYLRTKQSAVDAYLKQCEVPRPEKPAPLIVSKPRVHARSVSHLPGADRYRH